MPKKSNSIQHEPTQLIHSRVGYLDICKGLGMILVIWGHVLTTGPIRIWIYSFHMPLFFFLSGYTVYLSKPSNFLTFIKKRTKSLLVPYIVFGLLTYFYWLLVERKFRPETMAINPITPFIGIFYGNGTDSWLVFNIVLWFLPCIFTTELMFFIVSKRISNPFILSTGLLISSIVGFLISKDLHFRFSFGINIMFTSIVFYGCGFIFHKFWKMNVISNFYSFLLIGLLLVANVLFAVANQPIDMNQLYLGNYFYFYISAISGILSIFFFVQRIKGNIILEYIGRNTLAIMCIHEPVKRIIIKIVATKMHIASQTLRNSVLGSIVCTIFTLALCCFAAHIISRYAPFMVGKFKRNVLSSTQLQKQSAI